jgi:hypothetical protein
MASGVAEGDHSPLTGTNIECPTGNLIAAGYVLGSFTGTR